MSELPQALGSGMALLLDALTYPARATFDPADKASVVKLVTWIEDRKIRELDIDERGPLRASATFDAAFVFYLRAIECPHAWNANSDGASPANAKVLAWLLVRAVAYEYEERKPQIDAAAAAAAAPPPPTEPTGPAAGIASLPADCHAPFTSVCTQLDLDPATTSVGAALQAAVQEGRARNSRSGDGRGGRGGRVGHGVGGGGGDGGGDGGGTAAALSHAEALRILHIGSLRELQDAANDITVLAQDYTCAPKINNALGKVGR